MYKENLKTQYDQKPKKEHWHQRITPTQINAIVPI